MRRHSGLSTLVSQPSTRAAFTLVELLVAIAIFAILVTLSLSAFKESDQDRAAAGAQQLRSMIEGARSRAIHDQLPRGIRLLLGSNDPTDPASRYVTSIVYIGAPEQFAGTLDFARLHGGDLASGTTADEDGDMSLTLIDPDEYGWRNSDDAIIATVDNTPGGTPGFTTQWKIRENVFWPVLRQRGLLAHTGEFIGARIKIPTRTNTWFPIVGIESPFSSLGDTSDPDVPSAVRITIAGQFPLVEGSPRIYPTGEIQKYAKVSGSTIVEYELELAPPVLPGSVPQPLANGIGIDLDGSKLPTSWSGGGVYGNRLDILFSPRGEVIGSAAAAGVMHFVVVDTQAITEAALEAAAVPLAMRKLRYTDARAPALRVEDGSNPARDTDIPTKLNDRVVSLFARTGQVTTSQVNHFDPLRSPYEFGLAGKDNP